MPKEVTELALMRNLRPSSNAAVVAFYDITYKSGVIKTLFGIDALIYFAANDLRPDERLTGLLYEKRIEDETVIWNCPRVTRTFSSQMTSWYGSGVCAPRGYFPDVPIYEYLTTDIEYMTSVRYDLYCEALWYKDKFGCDLTPRIESLNVVEFYNALT